MANPSTSASSHEALMSLTRREFIKLSAAGIASTILPSSGLARATARPGIKGIAFDGFAIFDPRPIAALTDRLFPGKGAELGNAWRIRQFEYTWLRTLMGRYVNFWQVTEEALVFAVRTLKLELSVEKRSQLMQAFLEIKAWSDALPALKLLRDANMRLVLLANLTTQMMDAGVTNSGLEGIFEPHLSTDRVRAFKPDPRAYQMGIDAFRLRRQEIAFAAFGGWDAAGAKVFGYPTFWVNRASAPAEELGVAPDGTGTNLQDLAELVLSGR